MIELSQTADGVLVGVKAQAAAKKNSLRGEHAGLLKVSVTTAPEKGKANDAIADLLAAALAVRRSAVQIVAGHTQPLKKFLISGASLDEVREKIGRALENAQP